MERLDRRDLRFLLVCVLLVAVGSGMTAVLFRRAFPEASIEFRVNRGQARALAEKFLRSRSRVFAGSRFAGRFDVEEDAKVYLERELGLERARRFYGRDAKVWRWQMRWFRSGVKEEERVSITPLGELAAFDSLRRDDAPGARLSREAARVFSRVFLLSRGFPASALTPIEATPLSRPNRTDWTFVDERPGFRMGEATVRYATTVSGDELTGYREFVHVPEAWARDYQKLRSKNQTANLVGNLALFLTFLAMLGVLITKIVRKDVPWGLVAVFGVIACVLALLSTLNSIPLTLYDYDTASPLSAHLTERLVLGLLGAIGVGALIAMVVGSAEPIYRERFPGQISLSGLFSRRGLRSKRFFRGLVLGYAMTAFFFAYQAVFYVVAARLGAWAPAEIPYDDILNTALPWATVLFIGFLPAVLEEGSSRMFSISFLDRLGAGRFVAVVVPALIWGFNHAAYPNQPFYIRGVEVGFAGILIGLVMLRFGVLPLLVWHFTVDALYTALLLLRSGNAYFVVSGAVSSLILLLPLGAALLLYWRKGGFEPEIGLTNADLGSVAPRQRILPAEVEVPAARRVPARLLLGGAAAALLLASGFLVPLPGTFSGLGEDATGRSGAERIARSFLRANTVAAERFRSVAYTATGFVDDEQLRGGRPEENGEIPGFSDAAARFVISRGGLSAFRDLTRDRLPLDYWVVRFFQPERKEEWRVLVDARRARVVAFVNPKEEEAPAAAPPSPDRAASRALEAAARLGYPASAYSVADVGTRNRPKRTDTTVVLESRPVGIAEARPRLTAVFHGGRLSSLLPSIRVPEEFLRGYRKRSVLDWLLIGAKILALGSALGIAFVLVLRILRRGGVGWRGLVPPLLFLAPLSAAAFANAFPTLLRNYRTQIPLSAFVTAIAVSLLIGWILSLCAAALAFLLFSEARPGWRRAFRVGSLRDALLPAVLAALGLVGLSRWVRVAASRYPASFDLDPSLPSALETVSPGFALFWSALRTTLAIAAVAAVVALAFSQPFFRKPAGRLAAAALLLLVLAPTSFHSPGEFAADYLPALLVAAWLAFCAFGLLRDHVGAWVLFGAIAYGGRGIASLLSQPAAADRAGGWAGLLLVLIASLALLAGRRRAGAAPLPDPVESG